jgi:hypothetical protein
MGFIKELVKIFDFDNNEDYSDINLFEIDESDFIFLFCV